MRLYVFVSETTHTSMIITLFSEACLFQSKIPLPALELAFYADLGGSSRVLWTGTPFCDYLSSVLRSRDRPVDQVANIGLLFIF